MKRCFAKQSTLIIQGYKWPVLEKISKSRYKQRKLSWQD
jgi:hypothetical protein